MLRILISLSLPYLLSQDAATDATAEQERAPRVKEIVPADGATAVDPATDEIRVVFDMPMNHDGYSFVGGGPSFPAPRGLPRWIDAYTCVLPVALKPNRQYRFGINSKVHTSFRSVWLVPATPVECTFTTGGLDAVARSPEEQRKLNVESFDALADAIRRRYSYRDLRVTDWEKLFADHRVDVVKAPTAHRWMHRAAKMLSAARDVHMTLELDGDVIPTFSRDVRTDFSWSDVKRIIPDAQRHGSVGIGLTHDDIVYLMIGTWSSAVAEDVDRVHDFLSAHPDAAGVVIDVRPNSGGSELLARRLASRFVDESRTYAANVSRRGPGPDDFTPVRTRVIEPCDHSDESPCRYDGPVVVLTGPAVMSSCEAFLLMMKQAPRCTLIGARSYGGSGNPKPVFLPNGVRAMIPSWKSLTPDDRCIEGAGIEPDEAVPSPEADPAGPDPVLLRALQMLRQSADSH